MKLKFIHMEFEPNESDVIEKKHATVFEFKDGMWSANGPVWNRFVLMQGRIWQTVRDTLGEK